MHFKMIIFDIFYYYNQLSCNTSSTYKNNIKSYFCSKNGDVRVELASVSKELEFFLVPEAQNCTTMS